MRLSGRGLDLHSQVPEFNPQHLKNKIIVIITIITIIIIITIIYLIK